MKRTVFARLWFRRTPPPLPGMLAAAQDVSWRDFRRPCSGLGRGSLGGRQGLEPAVCLPQTAVR